MKRSKLFLTGTLVVAAIAAVAATKGMKQPLPFYYYQKGNACVYVNSQINCVPGQPVCKYVEGANSYQEYAQRISPSLCQTPLEIE